jgi:hypothetical protein
MDIEDAPLRPTPIERDDMGRFERKGGTTLKNSQKTVREPTVIEKVKITGPYKPGQSGNPKGRPKGSQNKTTVALKEAILAAGEAAGGKEGLVGYLQRLAIENSSAFASLLGKVLPTTLAADESSRGLAVKTTFERVIVYPNGHREIEGVTPKRLPSPSPVSVENNDQLICVEKPSQNSASDDQ